MKPGAEDARLRVSLSSLLALEPHARRLSFTSRQHAKSALNGRHRSRIRGRGLDFEELRDYLPSDDVRSIDWKVTARTGTPYVRVFTEERDRPTLIVVDQRMSMFYGSVLNMKSVTAAEAAAIAAFRVLEQGDRVGGLVVGDQHVAEFRPKRARSVLNQFLTALVHAGDMLAADAPSVVPVAFNAILKSVARIAPRNHLILLISDFDEVDARSKTLLSGLCRHNDVVMVMVTDPTSQALPQGSRIIASDGTLQAELNLGDEQVRRDLLDFSQGRLEEVLQWQNEMRLSVLPLTTAEPTLEQIATLLGRRGR